MEKMLTERLKMIQKQEALDKKPGNKIKFNKRNKYNIL